jgi:hypothetical protein
MRPLRRVPSVHLRGPSAPPRGWFLPAEQGPAEVVAGGTEEASEAFTLGGLHTREEQLAAEAEERYAEVWAKLDRKRNRRWLK